MMKSMNCEFCKLTMELAVLKAKAEADTAAAGGCYVNGLLDKDKATITIYGKISEHHKKALLDLLSEIDKTTRREYLEETASVAQR